MLESFLTPFLTILLAEMLDKSQLALIFLSTKTKRVIPIILGSILAFAIVDGAAVVFGSLVASVLPNNLLKIIAGLAFLVFGVFSLRAKQEKAEEANIRHHPIVSAFLIIFLSEWGDKTQLASATFATQFDPIFVFLGVMAAMTLLSFIAVLAGQVLIRHIKPTMLHTIAGIAFILIGLYLLFF